MRRALLLFLLCVLALAAPCAVVVQSERILEYHSDITLQDDGTMLVEETIRVLCAGNQIRHGIYRDFPTRYQDHLGNRYVVGFEVTGATRDGAPETFRVEDRSNGKRIYLGDKSYLVPYGEHTYTISYTTNRQLGFFPDHDELFWNVTGNGWGFVIERTSATVHLPEQIPAAQVQPSGFTGAQGSNERGLSTSSENGAFSFSANHRLGQGYGLTILLSWLKGFIAEPTQQQKITWFFHDNRDALLLSGAVVLLLLYYFAVWSAVGRDPARGVIMPRYEPPANLSPAAMRYLVRMGYDHKAFSAAILDMAVRGFINIKEDGGTYTLNRTKADNRVLSPDEKSLATVLFDGRSDLWLQNENHTLVSAGIKTLKAWLKIAEQKIYFVTNSRYMIPAVLFSALSLAGVVAMQNGPKVILAGFISFWLSFWSLGVAGLAKMSYHQWSALLQSQHKSPAMIGAVVFFSLFALPFVAGELVGLALLVATTSWFVALFLLLNVGIHILFHYLLKAPTRAGRQLLDQVEGFKLFLGRVDGDRLNRVTPPDQTPQTFERFLPYALALDLEQDWAEKFSGVLAAAGQAPGDGGSSAPYMPSFYSGAAFNGASFSGFTSSLDSFTGAISSASSAPGSGDGGGSGGSGRRGWGRGRRRMVGNLLVLSSWF